VKVKIYSILLLFTFLAVISHEIIPHYHHPHEERAENSLTHHHKTENHSHHEHDHFHHSHDHEKQKDESDTDERDKHSFPNHHHFLYSLDYKFLRLSTKFFSLTTANFFLLLNKDSFSFRISDSFVRKAIKPPKSPPLMNPVFEPGATGLRAPPFIS
jgi:hypothetical protein